MKALSMDDSTRRQFLQMSGVTGTIGLTGCLRSLRGGGTPTQGVKDTDGDGVIDSEDYAPRDPEVQRKEQLQENSTTTECQTPTEQQTSTETEGPEGTSAIVDDFERSYSQWNLQTDRTTVSISRDRSNHGQKSLKCVFDGDGINQNADFYAPSTAVTEGTRISIWFHSSSFGQGLSLFFGDENNGYRGTFQGWEDQFKIIRVTPEGLSDRSATSVTRELNGWVKISVIWDESVRAELWDDEELVSQVETPKQASFNSPSIGFKVYASMSPKDAIYVDWLVKSEI
jgi:hypothetical protein